jgi:DNA-binding IclR family transcriptional regulator
MSNETKQENVGAPAREVLEWLADRPSKAVTIGFIADSLEAGVPKLHGALASLREQGAVQHFKGDPGTWSITRRGYALVKFDTANDVSRFRMALEAVAMCEETYSGALAAKKIANKALGDA